MSTPPPRSFISKVLHSVPVVPASSTYSVAVNEGNMITYPPKDDGLVYTYASYSEDLSDRMVKLSPDGWTLTLSIPTPSTPPQPVLKSITYIIKYATTHDNGNSTVQADIILTTATCPIGILARSTDLGVYRNGPGYGPRMVDSAKALCLSSAPAIKCNGGTAQWSHYIDHKHLLPNAHIVGAANLYLNFHVFEYSTVKTRRFLAIEISAAWCNISEVSEDSSDHDVAEVGQLRSTPPRVVSPIYPELSRQENVLVSPIFVPREEGLLMASALPSREDVFVPREEGSLEATALPSRKDVLLEVTAIPHRSIAPAVANEAVQSLRWSSPRQDVLVEAAASPQLSIAPAVANEAVQSLIENKIDELKLEPCPQGFMWDKTATGYRCQGGAHSISFEQLAARP